MCRARLERVNAYPDQIPGKAQRKLRDAIPSVDELSSAVSRVNVAPWEDPFALSLGQAAPIAEEGALSITPLPRPLVLPHVFPSCLSLLISPFILG